MIQTGGGTVQAVELTCRGVRVVIPTMSPDARYPDWRRILPAWEGEDVGSVAGRTRVTPSHLAEACEWMPGMHTKALLPSVRWRMPADDLSPIRLDGTDPDLGSLAAVIMPVRA
jgi:hypothetical protein